MTSFWEKLRQIGYDMTMIHTVLDAMLVSVVIGAPIAAITIMLASWRRARD